VGSGAKVIACWVWSLYRPWDRTGLEEGETGITDEQELQGPDGAS